jgi:deoxycytidylate deaminase
MVKKEHQVPFFWQNGSIMDDREAPQPRTERGGTDSAPHTLVIGLAGPYAAGCSAISEEMRSTLAGWSNCHADVVKVSDLIPKWHQLKSGKKIKSPPDENPLPERRRELQKLGTALRSLRRTSIGEGIATEIVRLWKSAKDSGSLPSPGTHVVIIDSIKNLHEISVLRKCYPKEFFLLFVHASVDVRWARLTQHKNWVRSDNPSFLELDEIDRNEKAENAELNDAGQQVGKLASMADYYLVNDENIPNRDKMREAARRFLEMVFGLNHHPPNEDESSMHIAYAASLQSYCMSRQVGAAILDDNGNTLAVGHNDVPCYSGGLYTHGNPHESRCYVVGDKRCKNNAKKRATFSNVTRNIAKALELSDTEEEERVSECISTSTLASITEYCRAVHAEMEAILSLVRSGGPSTIGTKMYVTTQPCHNCTKHIIAAGIKRVVFIEPYPKSLAQELHGDALSLCQTTDQSTENSKKVLFALYAGVAPKRFEYFFSAPNGRKDKFEKLITRSTDDCTKNPRFARDLQPRRRDDKDPRTEEVEETLTLSNFGSFIQPEAEKQKQENS